MRMASQHIAKVMSQFKAEIRVRVFCATLICAFMCGCDYDDSPRWFNLTVEHWVESNPKVFNRHAGTYVCTIGIEDQDGGVDSLSTCNVVFGGNNDKHIYVSVPISVFSHIIQNEEDSMLLSENKDLIEFSSEYHIFRWELNLYGNQAQQYEYTFSSAKVKHKVDIASHSYLLSFSAEGKHGEHEKFSRFLYHDDNYTPVIGIELNETSIYKDNEAVSLLPLAKLCILGDWFQ